MKRAAQSTIIAPDRSSRRAFTLIELLVVIAILAVLIGILLPALGKARDTARTVTCSSRMRQLAIGWYIYAESNQDVSVPGQPGRYADESRNVYPLGNGDHYRPRWFAVIGAAAGFDAYAQPSPDRADEHTLPVDGSDVFLCPVVPEWTSTRNYAYGYNYQFLGNTRFRSRTSDASGLVNFPVRASSIESSATVLAADALGTAASAPEALRTSNRPDGSRDPQFLAEGGHGYALDPPRLEATAERADATVRGSTIRSAPHARHGGKVNVSFCDGHVETITPREMGYAVNADGSFPLTGPDATNQRFSGASRDLDPPELDPV
jgi:prepilin-type processing-associated H-X9-DG protein/prepilin-type N-terminal cleavage/methylation domain-containing protein